MSPRTTFAERCQLTVMFCDLVGSTALSVHLDVEDFHEVIAAYQKRVAEIVTGFDGFVARRVGDGVLVYFGFPHTGEDDAEQALRASLALVDGIAALESREPLQVRIGIATGVVVVGDLAGSGIANDTEVLGEGPNLAARLQAVATPNSIVIADSTRRLVGSVFGLEDLGFKEFKGFAEPQRAWRVLGENRFRSRLKRCVPPRRLSSIARKSSSFCSDAGHKQKPAKVASSSSRANPASASHASRWRSEICSVRSRTPICTISAHPITRTAPSSRLSTCLSVRQDLAARIHPASSWTSWKR